MGLSELTIEISQRYANRSIKVTNENGKYHVVYQRISHTSPSVDRYPRVLSITEAVWLEKQVENTIKNPDDSTWQSLVGGDTMNIVIKRNNDTDISLRGAKPIRKYSDLQDELENLAQYGYSIVKDNAFYEYDAAEEKVFNDVIYMLIFSEIFQMLLNSQASEQGARMTSMDNATRNAADMIGKLTLKYNRLRQSAITTELVEIISGAEAL